MNHNFIGGPLDGAHYYFKLFAQPQTLTFVRSTNKLFILDLKDPRYAKRPRHTYVFKENNFHYKQKAVRQTKQ